jgi:RHS repeat-associated protein
VLQATHTYYPFGREASSTSADSEPMKFTGHERDLHLSASATADDLDYMHARFSSPLTGRFLSADAAAHRNASAVPQGWNRYAYVHGNPVVYTDPDGKTAVAAILSVSGTAAAGTAAAAAGAVAFAGGSGWFAGRIIGETVVGGQSINSHISDGLSALVLWMGAIIKDPATGDYLDDETGAVVLPAPLPADVLVPGTLDTRGGAAEAAEKQRVYEELSKTATAEELEDAFEAVIPRAARWLKDLFRGGKADKEKTEREADEEPQNGE